MAKLGPIEIDVKLNDKATPFLELLEDAAALLKQSDFVLKADGSIAYEPIIDNIAAWLHRYEELIE